MARLLWRARLHQPRDFKAALEQGRRIGGKLLTAVIRDNGLPHPRLGLALAKKNIAHATMRNRIKRQIRESFRQRQAELPAVDIVIFAKPAAGAAPAMQLRAALDELWARTIQKCAA